MSGIFVHGDNHSPDSERLTVRPFQPEDLEEVRAIFREYAASVGPEICFESFEAELAGLPEPYAQPGGRIFLGDIGGRIAACVALRWCRPGIGEMKRLYVRPAFRGASLGLALATRVIEEACSLGYTRLRLDTLPRMERALALYRDLGFVPIPPYASHPASALCFELNLVGRRH